MEYENKQRRRPTTYIPPSDVRHENFDHFPVYCDRNRCKLSGFYLIIFTVRSGQKIVKRNARLDRRTAHNIEEFKTIWGAAARKVDAKGVQNLMKGIREKLGSFTVAIDFSLFLLFDTNTIWQQKLQSLNVKDNTLWKLTKILRKEKSIFLLSPLTMKRLSQTNTRQTHFLKISF